MFTTTSFADAGCLGAGGAAAGSWTRLRRRRRLQAWGLLLRRLLLLGRSAGRGGGAADIAMSSGGVRRGAQEGCERGRRCVGGEKREMEQGDQGAGLFAADHPGARRHEGWVRARAQNSAGPFVTPLTIEQETHARLRIRDDIKRDAQRQTALRRFLFPTHARRARATPSPVPARPRSMPAQRGLAPWGWRRPHDDLTALHHHRSEPLAQPLPELPRPGRPRAPRARMREPPRWARALVPVPAPGARPPSARQRGGLREGEPPDCSAETSAGYC